MPCHSRQVRDHGWTVHLWSDRPSKQDTKGREKKKKKRSMQSSSWMEMGLRRIVGSFSVLRSPSYSAKGILCSTLFYPSGVQNSPGQLGHGCRIMPSHRETSLEYPPRVSDLLPGRKREREHSRLESGLTMD